MPQATLSVAVKTRLRADDKKKIKQIADERQLDDADIVREAIREYIAKHLPGKKAS